MPSPAPPIAHPRGVPSPVSGLPEDLARARAALLEAERTVADDERFLAGHLVALRVAAVVLALRYHPQRARRPRNAWRTVAEAAPALAGWASFYAASEDRRDAVRAGRAGVVSALEADDLVRTTGYFLDLIERALGQHGGASASVGGEAHR